MLTQKAPGETGKPAAATAPTAAPAAAAPALEDLICYFEGKFVPMRDAKISIMTHAFLYGTATFEGIRAYWSEERQTLFGLFFREHMARLRRNAAMLLMDDLPTVDELVDLVVQTASRNNLGQDLYIRPSFYKSTRAIGVRLHHLEHELYIVAMPFGNYVDIDKGIRLMSSSWRRNADEALPARGKIVGGYVNMAFQKSEAELNGFDEALVLTAGGHASEASAANMFVVRDGVLLTPPVNDDILEGVTRRAIFELAAAHGISVEVRSIDRSEIYVADEMFLVGTGVQLAAVVELDHRKIGDGEIGPITRTMRQAYFEAVRGRAPAFGHWLTPIPIGG
ncbi:MAG: Branched-chain-amino-acid aminotransferase [Chloroflexi bacterium]|nr:Branched-chain-amino-acid aminotransferase [Chloroflexota bacterium]